METSNPQTPEETPEEVINPITANEADLQIINKREVQYQGVTYHLRGAAAEQTTNICGIQIRPNDNLFSEYDAMFNTRGKEGTRCLTVPNYSQFHGTPTPCVFMEVKSLSTATEEIDNDSGRQALDVVA